MLSSLSLIGRLLPLRSDMHTQLMVAHERAASHMAGAQPNRFINVLGVVPGERRDLQVVDVRACALLGWCTAAWTSVRVCTHTLWIVCVYVRACIVVQSCLLVCVRACARAHACACCVHAYAHTVVFRRRSRSATSALSNLYALHACRSGWGALPCI